MPANAKYVGRQTKWGNPFRLTTGRWIVCLTKNGKWIYWSASGGFSIEDVVQLYERWITGKLKDYRFLPDPPDIEELRGFDLACWCPLDKPCHVDVLVKLLQNCNGKF